MEDHQTKTNRKKISLTIDDHDADADTLFQPKRSSKNNNLRTTTNSARDTSHSFTSSHLSLTDVSPLTDRASSFEFINLIGSDSDHVFGGESDADHVILSDSHDEDFLSIYSSDRRRLSSSQIENHLNKIEKEETSDMLEAVESTFNQLGKRTKDMFETLERVNKKHTKTSSEFRSILDIIKDMREETQLLIKRQEKIAKDFRLAESKSAASSDVDSSAGYLLRQPAPQRHTKTYDLSDDEEPVITRKKPKTYDLSDNDEPIPVEKSSVTNVEKKSYGLTQSEIESEEEWERKREEKRKQLEVELAADEDESEVATTVVVDDKKPTIVADDNDEVRHETPSDEVLEEVKRDEKTEQEEIEPKPEPEIQVEEKPIQTKVDNRTLSEIESDEEWEQQQELKQKQKLAELNAADENDKPKPAPVDNRTPSEIESDEEWERQLEAKKKELEAQRNQEFEEEEERIRLEALKLAQEEQHDEEYDEEKARAAALAIAGLKDE